MTTFASKPVPQINWSLVPAAYDAWGAPTEEYLDRATYKRAVWFMPWNSHIVAEGIK